MAAGEKFNFQQTDITFVGDAIEDAETPGTKTSVQSWVVCSTACASTYPQRYTATYASRPAACCSAIRPGSFPAMMPILPSSLSWRSSPRDLEPVAHRAGDGLQIEGNTALHTNLHPVFGLLTLMQALPPETAFRTDTSLIWTGLSAEVEAQKQTVLALLPVFPRRLEAYHPCALPWCCVPRWRRGLPSRAVC